MQDVDILNVLLKLFYYQYQHPWMKLSPARGTLDKVSKAIIGLIGLTFVVGMPLISL